MVPLLCNPSLSLGACSDSWPSSLRCYRAISSPVAPFSFCFQPFHPHGLFQRVLHIMWLKHWSFSISPPNEYSGLISFRIDWFDLLTAQETLKSLCQQHNSKATIHCHSALFITELSHSDMTIGKTIAWLYGPLSAK